MNDINAEHLAQIPAQAFECEIHDGPNLQVSQDGEYLDFDIDSSCDNGDESPVVALGVHQVMLLRDLCDRFLALPVNAVAVEELMGML